MSWFRKDTPKLPPTLLDRVGEAAAGVYTILDKHNLYDEKHQNLDEYIWENASYLIATLEAYKAISGSQAVRLRTRLAMLYPEGSDYKELCRRWTLQGVIFYKRIISASLSGAGHYFPDVLVYNLSHPTCTGRKDFNDLPINLNALSIANAYETIYKLVGRYFPFGEEDLSQLPIS